ncbi:MAG TPA: arsenical pump-driving ATPase [Thermoanaerobaculia bacterium]|nr:arsenical pump-driving ATPase [Thermoanaerobaculia bacterium]
MPLPFAPPRIVFFTGKGGVGKTSLACATAVALADSGRRVLLVSTDPASNLDEVLGVALASTPVPIPAAPGLFGLNINAEAAAHAYRERIVGPLRGVMPPAVLTSIEEQLSGACTTEIAAFDKFTRLLGDPTTTASFDHVIFDTAPTGHTLRLLKLPAAWEGFLATNTTGTSCLGPLSGLQAQRSIYQASLSALADSATTTVALVTRPDPSALAEAERTRAELAAIGISNQRLIVNGAFTATNRQDPVAMALERRNAEALDKLPDELARLPRHDVTLRPWAPLGIDRLRALFAPSPPSASAACVAAAPLPTAPLSELIDTCESAGRGVIMTMGKGGVGKTTMAAAIAVELGRRGHAVHLTTTDPAAHLLATLDHSASGLRVTRIDPVAETRAYSAEVMATSGAGLDEAGRELLAEDLRSPCTEEIAVFRAFARAVGEASRGFVVIDTAPTGHTLLLLDAAQAYHREVERTHGNVPADVRELLPRLRDPEFTKVILVTLPEATPVHEAAALQSDLRRAGIEPFAWVVNQSFAATTTADAALAARGEHERAYIAEVLTSLARQAAIVAWQMERPVGAAALLSLAQGTGASTTPVVAIELSSAIA